MCRGNYVALMQPVHKTALENVLESLLYDVLQKPQ
jgi:hypothetical protein